ncbi:GTP-binding protein GEM [Fasciola gigantica]|uniref:GTP-binding protein GEM n=1 Tax=Fasciola gigantica TaxID=46835 RepID=A0A504YHA0_FASGI|nr:GTP-binding protein GEM [Fasciola gigantica]
MEINDDFERFCQIAQRSPRNSLSPVYHSPESHLGRRSTQCGYLTFVDQSQVKRSSSFREPRQASHVSSPRASGNISSARSPVRSDRRFSPTSRGDISATGAAKRASFSSHHRINQGDYPIAHDEQDPRGWYVENAGEPDESRVSPSNRMCAANRHRAGSMKETGRKRPKAQYRPSAPAVFTGRRSPPYTVEPHSPGRYANQNQTNTVEEQLVHMRRFQRTKDGHVISKGDRDVPQIELHRSMSPMDVQLGSLALYPQSPVSQNRPIIYMHDASDRSGDSSASDNEVIEIPAITTSLASPASHHGSSRVIQSSALQSPHTLCPESRNRSKSWAYVYEPELAPAQHVPSPARLDTAMSDQPLTVQVLGSSRVGKTSLCMQFQTSESLDVTLECAQEDELARNLAVEVNNEKFHLILVDTNLMHDEFLDSSEPDIIESADAYVVVYAIDDRSTYTTAHAIVNYLLGKCKRSSAIILVANKSDLVRTRAVSTDEAKNLADIYSCLFYEISTALNHRVDELLVGIIEEIKRRRLEVDRERDRLDRMASTKKRVSSSHSGHRRSFAMPKSTANNVVKFFQKYFSRKEQKGTHNPY